MSLPCFSYTQYRAERRAPGPAGYTAEREQVCQIIEAVRNGGDAAVRDFTERFDGVRVADLRVSEAEIDAAEKQVKPALREAIRRAGSNIERFHRRQAVSSWWDVEQGRLVGQRLLPLRSAGAYVPGGTAAYPSSVLMTVIPARVAGVREICLCTPPGPGGMINPLTLAAAREAGAGAVFKAGGAQAVAALAYGTETIPAVQKIVGPGNIYVTLAKREVFGHVGIDLLAGPSEIAVVADDCANPAFIAADLLSQAEHDPLARALLITASERLARRVAEEVSRQLRDLPRRETAERALKEQGAVILVSSLEEAWTVVNDLAPEHLELHLADPWRCLDRIENAGAVFIGAHAPESLGDYWAGPNHVLPTGGTARYASPLGVADFMKSTNILYYTPEALREAAPWIERLARAEGLEAHARAVKMRMRRRQDGERSRDHPGDPGDED